MSRLPENLGPIDCDECGERYEGEDINDYLRQVEIPGGSKLVCCHYEAEPIDYTERDRHAAAIEALEASRDAYPDAWNGFQADALEALKKEASR